MARWQGKAGLTGLGVSAGVMLAVLGIIWLGGNFSPLQRHLRQGDAAQAAGNYVLAFMEFNLALKASPGNWDVQVKIAGAMLAQADWSEADKLLSSLLAKDGNRSKSLYPLLLRSKLGLAEAARAKEPNGSDLARMYLQAAQQYDPENPEVKRLLAEERYFQVLKMPADISEGTLQEIIRLDPQPRYKLELAARYLQLGKTKEFDQAVSSFTPQDLAAEGIAPALAQSFINYARRYRPNLAEEKRILAEGLAVLPGDPRLLLEQLHSLVAAGDKQGYGQLLTDPSLEDWKRQVLQNYLAAVRNNAFVKKEKVYYLQGTPLQQGMQAMPVQGMQVFRTSTGTWLTWVENVAGGSSLVAMDLASERQKVLAKADGPITGFALSKAGSVAYQVDKYTRQDGGQSSSELIFHTSQSHVVLEQAEGPGGYRYYNPAFSPDGKFLVYYNGNRVVLLELSTGRRLQPGSGGEFVAGWAPDSSRFLLVSYEQKQGTTWTVAKVMNVEGKQLAELPAQEGVTYLGWRPDGKLAASRLQVNQQAVPPFPQLFLVDEQSQQFTLLTSDNFFPESVSQWSPDGRFDAFVAQSNELWLYREGVRAPFPVIYPGTFIGWSGPDSLLFAVTGKGSPGFGDGGTVPIEKVVVLTLSGE